jgi:DNA modification methylase
MEMSSFVFQKLDARHLLEVFPRSKKGVPKESVDVTITSPPYWNLKDYGSGNQIGYNQPYSVYLQDLEKVFADVFLITKNNGSLWIVVDTFTKKEKDESLSCYKMGELVPLVFDVIRIVRNSGWNLRDILVWQKDKTLPWSRKGQLRNIFEYILFFTKTNKYKFYTNRIRVPDQNQFKEWWVKYPERYNPNGITPTNLWYFPIPVQGSWATGYIQHFCPFPVSLVERILLLTTNKGNMVFDPFAGSGIVMAVAQCMNRRSIGLELKPEYVQRFRNHILEDVKKEMSQLRQEQQQQLTKQRILREKIGRLRLTKYPRMLVKKLNLGPDQIRTINSIFAIASNRSGSKTGNSKDKLHEDIYLVFESERGKENIKGSVTRVVQKPPLSKFGIEVAIHLVTRDNFVSEQRKSPSFEHNNLWLYIKGKTNMFHEGITFKKWVDLCMAGQWKEFFKQNVPPIISNVRIRQAVPSTWSPRDKMLTR